MNFHVEHTFYTNPLVSLLSVVFVLKYSSCINKRDSLWTMWCSVYNLIADNSATRYSNHPCFEDD